MVESPNLVFHNEMAAHDRLRDKILRVSMPFGGGTNLLRKRRESIPQKRWASRYGIDPWSVVLKVHSWAEQLREGTVQTRAEIARREAITPARVSQLWPLSEIARELADVGQQASNVKKYSLQRLIRIARNLNVKSNGCEGGKRGLG